jgi:histone deacetylase 1/2
VFCRGLNYALNMPLKDGVSDKAYAELFRPVLAKVMEVYLPEAIVFQSGKGILPTSKFKRCPNIISVHKSRLSDDFKFRHCNRHL